jgi:hypothetical protein
LKLEKTQNWRLSQNEELSKSIFASAQYVTPDSKIYCEKVKMFQSSSGNWFFCTKFVQLAVTGKRRNTGRAPPKKSVINWT